MGETVGEGVAGMTAERTTTAEPQWEILHDMDHQTSSACPYCQKERAAIEAAARAEAVKEWREAVRALIDSDEFAALRHMLATPEAKP